MDDAALVRCARQGSREAAAALFSRHWPAAWRAARAITGRREMADDVAQDAFERAFAALSRFDERRPFAPWLHRIVINRSLDLMRQERRLIGLDRIAEPVFDGEDTDAAERRLLETVSSFAQQRRVAVVLRYGLGYTPAEIAELLGLPVGTVHSRLARALDDLRTARTEADVERA